DLGNVKCAGGSATFTDVIVGTWQVNATGLGLTGSAAGNYDLSPPTASASAKIIALKITASIVADDKNYDGTNAAKITCSLNGVVAIDLGNVKCTGGSATFADFNIGVWEVFATGLGLTGSAAANYNLSPATATGSAKIIALTITASIVAKDKPYDGTT